MWFWLSVLAMVFWSGSDLFSKIGCRSSSDKVSHLKMGIAVGMVMGIHALVEICTGTKISLEIIIKYLPVSALYIISMIIGYISLRYIELSVSTPICNSSGAIVAVMALCTKGISGVDPMQLVAIAFVCIGVTALGFAEAFEDDDLRRARQDKANFHYAKSALAIVLPIIYCLLDALGTFADGLVLETLDEDSANVAYELTFFAVGIVSLLYLLIKGHKFTFRAEVPKYIGATFETVGQFAYIYAIADSKHIMFSAPIISSYCVLSIIWSRLFLKERLTLKHYLAIALTVVGIAIIGFYDP